GETAAGLVLGWIAARFLARDWVLLPLTVAAAGGGTITWYGRAPVSRKRRAAARTGSSTPAFRAAFTSSSHVEGRGGSETNRNAACAATTSHCFRFWASSQRLAARLVAIPGSLALVAAIPSRAQRSASSKCFRSSRNMTSCS